MMKSHLLIDTGLLFLIPLGIIGFSVSSQTDSPADHVAGAQHNHLKQTTDTAYTPKGRTIDTSQIQSLDFRASRVYRVTYAKTTFRAPLEADYREQRLYRYVPGSKKNNRTYSWSRIKARVGKRVYVDMKAKAYYRDDDGERESEDFYRIRVSKSTTAQKYWVNEDVFDD